MAAFGRPTHGLGGVAPHPRNVLGEAPRFAFRDAVDLGDVGHGGAPLKGVHRADHGHVLLSVSLEDVADHLVPAVPRQVEVDVGELGELHPLAIQKTLEGQAEAERANVADAQHVAHQAAGRAAPRQRPDILRRAPLHQVGEHQEVLRVADLFDDAQLALQALAHARLGIRTVAPFDARLNLRSQQRHRVLAREFREPDVAQFEIEAAALGHAQRVLHRLPQAAEVARHLLFAVPVAPPGRELFGMALVQQRQRAHRGQDVVTRAVRGSQVVRVARRHQRHAVAAPQRREQARQVQVLVRVRRHLQHQIRAVNAAQKVERGRGVGVALDGTGDLAARPGQANQTFGELLQAIGRQPFGMLDPRRQQAAQIAVAARVFDQ